ncbi:hypothetical protein EE612_023650 [Oryza sativa]|nr:hypothetical protein EE612_023650 [Oryza sativa]
MVHNTRPSVNSAKIKSENHEVESNNVGHFIMSQRKKKKHEDRLFQRQDEE